MLTESHKTNISNALKGRKPKNFDYFMEKRDLYRHTEEHRRKISDALKGKHIGEKSPRWKGGRTLNYWKKTVKNRDGQCMKCGNKDFRVLTADHIKSKKMYPNLMYEVSNGITLCHNCHAIKTLEDKEYREWMSYRHWNRKNSMMQR